MERRLFDAVLNREIKLDVFLKWLVTNEAQGDLFEKIRGFAVGRNDFLAYFLNFVHEEIPRSPGKINTPQRAKENRRNKWENVRNSIDESANESFEEGNCSFKSCGSSSTPKIQRIPFDSNSSSSFCSPVSPLCRNNKSFSLNDEKRHKSFEKFSPVRLGDFPVTKRNYRKKHYGKTCENEDSNKRRINPTAVGAKKSNCSFGDTENSFNFQSSCHELPADSYNEQRNILAEERIKILSRRDSAGIPNRKMQNSPTVLNRNEINPEVYKVTKKTALDCVVRIYVQIVTNNLVLNVASEIYFLISLLQSKFYDDGLDLGVESLNGRICARELFESVHNIVYFAARCLDGLETLLKFYDRATLRLLSVNVRLQSFCDKLTTRLWPLAAGSTSEEKKERSVETVRFNSDTDNRENFPDDSAFHAFRKQRDAFYEILRLWGTERRRPGFNFAVALGPRVLTLLSLSADPADHVHLCRLFKAQMLAVGDKPQTEDEADGAPPPGVTTAVDAEKLRRLRRRLETPEDGGTAASADFYRSFAEAATAAFREHLANAFAEHVDRKAARLLDVDIEPDQNSRTMLLGDVKMAKVLAGFLGFLEALPYKSRHFYPDKLLQTYIKLRKYSKCRLDLKSALEDSKRRNRLILTLPWMIEYLQELDYVALRTPYYSDILGDLLKIHKSFKGSKLNATTVRFLLGRLFDLPHCPDFNFYEFIEEIPYEELVDVNTIDGNDVFDQGALYELCPFLEETKRLLVSNSTTGGRGSAPTRHIRPLTAAPSDEEAARRRLERRFEESFLSGQPPSTRKTVEFVAERVASACVKHICNSLVPRAKLEPAEASPEGRLRSLRAQCSSETSRIAGERCEAAVSALLPPDSPLQTRTVAVTLTERACLERVRRWADGHLVPSLFARSVAAGHQEERLAFALPPAGRGRSRHDDNEPPAGFEMLRRLQEFACTVLERPGEVDESQVRTLLEDITDGLKKRGDVNDAVIGNVCSVLLDIAFLLAAHRPEALSEGATDRFARVFVLHPRGTSLFSNLFSPRNVRLLQQSSDAAGAWRTLAAFAARLVAMGAVDADHFEAQCAAFYRVEWRRVVLRHFSAFLREFIDRHKRLGGNVDEFVVLLEFLSEFCNDL